jgi:hypothetical protein
MARIFCFPRDIPPIDSDRRRAAKPECPGHRHIRDRYLMNLSRYTGRSQSLFESHERGWKMRTLRHVKNFNLQFALSCLTRLARARKGSGQIVYAVLSCNYPTLAEARVPTYEDRSASAGPERAFGPSGDRPVRKVATVCAAVLTVPQSREA